MTRPLPAGAPDPVRVIKTTLPPPRKRESNAPIEGHSDPLALEPRWPFG